MFFPAWKSVKGCLCCIIKNNVTTILKGQVQPAMSREKRKEFILAGQMAGDMVSIDPKDAMMNDPDVLAAFFLDAKEEDRLLGQLGLEHYTELLW